jgi:hypothetical protein
MSQSDDEEGGGDFVEKVDKTEDTAMKGNIHLQ